MSPHIGLPTDGGGTGKSQPEFALQVASEGAGAHAHGTGKQARGPLCSMVTAASGAGTIKPWRWYMDGL